MFYENVVFNSLSESSYSRAGIAQKDPSKISGRTLPLPWKSESEGDGLG